VILFPECRESSELDLFALHPNGLDALQNPSDTNEGARQLRRP
jgi:hypothetical protein